MDAERTTTLNILGIVCENVDEAVLRGFAIDLQKSNDREKDLITFSRLLRDKTTMEEYRRAIGKADSKALKGLMRKRGLIPAEGKR